MTDHPIPDDLLDRLAREFYDAGVWCGECDYELVDERRRARKPQRRNRPLHAHPRPRGGNLMDLPKWPKTPPTADEMIRYCAALGLYQSAQAVDLVGVTRGQGALGAARLRLNAEQMIANYDRIRLLRALVALAPAAADAEASNMWLAAEGGDSYGECLWEWADEYGLEADRICEASRSALALEGDR